MPAVTCPPAHQSHERLSRHIKVALTNLIFCTDVVNEPKNGLNDGLSNYLTNFFTFWVLFQLLKTLE